MSPKSEGVQKWFDRCSADKIIAIYALPFVLDQFHLQSQDKRTCFVISNMSDNKEEKTFSNLNYAIFTHEQRQENQMMRWAGLAAFLSFAESRSYFFGIQKMPKFAAHVHACLVQSVVCAYEITFAHAQWLYAMRHNGINQFTRWRTMETGKRTPFHVWVSMCIRSYIAKILRMREKCTGIWCHQWHRTRARFINIPIGTKWTDACVDVRTMKA